ncbi:MAG: hypothetical protein KF841_07420 [Phycisphaerae bacterium]|nr:hypothetical protein [Phycisphaerae bacterium]
MIAGKWKLALGVAAAVLMMAAFNPAEARAGDHHRRSRSFGVYYNSGYRGDCAPRGGYYRSGYVSRSYGGFGGYYGGYSYRSYGYSSCGPRYYAPRPICAPRIVYSRPGCW